MKEIYSDITGRYNAKRREISYCNQHSRQPETLAEMKWLKEYPFMIHFVSYSMAHPHMHLGKPCPKKFEDDISYRWLWHTLLAQVAAGIP